MSLINADFSWLYRASLCGLLVVATGCGSHGPATAPVRGTVTLNGKPLNTGTVMFIPDPTGPYAYGQIGADGTYQLTTSREGDGAVLGEHRVIVSAVEFRSVESPGVSLLPEKYGSEQTSGLTASVKDQEENVVDLSLESGRRANSR